VTGNTALVTAAVLERKAIQWDNILCQGIKQLGIWGGDHDDEDSSTSFRSVELTLGDGSNRFVVCEHHPAYFSRMRSDAGLEDVAFLRSIVGDSLLSFKSNSLGSRDKDVDFFWTSDRRYMIKTLSSHEVDQMERILPAYNLYLKENPRSFLSRFCGLYSVVAPAASFSFLRTRKSYLVMRNALHPSISFDVLYDLKGSQVGRRTLFGDTSRSQKQQRRPNEPGTVLKDLDLLESEQRLHLRQDDRQLLIGQLIADARFLRELSVMDYSLLIGVYRSDVKHLVRNKLGRFVQCVPVVPRFLARVLRGTLGRWRLGEFFGFKNDGEAAELARAGNAVISSDQQSVIFLGIIDYLQPYNRKKWLETCWKGLAHDTSKLSSVHPDFYSRRFINFIESVVFPAPQGA